jgi:hypothetical protein
MICCLRYLKETAVKQTVFTVLATALCAALALPLLAHHSVSAVFVMDKQILLKGELSDVDWVNPHIFVYVKVKNASGTVETWKVEGGPPAWYRRININSATFRKRIGEQVTIDGLPSKTGENYSYMKKVTFADGDTFESASPADVSKGK